MDVHSADQIATLLLLKEEVESTTGNSIKLTLTGCSEAHLLAKEIGEAGVGVILNPVRPFPSTWDQRRMYVLPHSKFVMLVDLWEQTTGPSTVR